MNGASIRIAAAGPWRPTSGRWLGRCRVPGCCHSRCRSRRYWIVTKQFRFVLAGPPSHDSPSASLVADILPHTNPEIDLRKTPPNSLLRAHYHADRAWHRGGRSIRRFVRRRCNRHRADSSPPACQRIEGRALQRASPRVDGQTWPNICSPQFRPRIASTERPGRGSSPDLPTSRRRQSSTRCIPERRRRWSGTARCARSCDAHGALARR